MIRRMKRQAKRRLHQPWSNRRIRAHARRAVAAAIQEVYERFRLKPVRPIIGARFSPDVWAL